LNLKVNQVARDYLEAIANAGTYGNNWTDVAYRFIGEGIERAIREKVIPRREAKVGYPIADQSKPVADR
jgi:hypothetical protein